MIAVFKQANDPDSWANPLLIGNGSLGSGSQASQIPLASECAETPSCSGWNQFPYFNDVDWIEFELAVQSLGLVISLIEVVTTIFHWTARG